MVPPNPTEHGHREVRTRRLSSGPDGPHLPLSGTFPGVSAGCSERSPIRVAGPAADRSARAARDPWSRLPPIRRHLGSPGQGPAPERGWLLRAESWHHGGPSAGPHADNLPMREDGREPVPGGPALGDEHSVEMSDDVRDEPLAVASWPSSQPRREFVALHEHDLVALDDARLKWTPENDDRSDPRLDPAPARISA
jgi:hypothetical protein